MRYRSFGSDKKINLLCMSHINQNMHYRRLYRGLGYNIPYATYYLPFPGYLSMWLYMSVGRGSLDQNRTTLICVPLAMTEQSVSSHHRIIGGDGECATPDVRNSLDGDANTCSLANGSENHPTRAFPQSGKGERGLPSKSRKWSKGSIA